MTLTPPGWHDDPDVPGRERYWDGHIWTADRRPRPTEAPGRLDVRAKARVRDNMPSIIAIGLGLLAYLFNPLGLVSMAAILAAASGISQALNWRKEGRGTAGLSLAIVAIIVALGALAVLAGHYAAEYK